MSSILSIGTAVPPYRHKQQEILDAMLPVYGLEQQEERRLAYMYRHSGIDYRYSVIEALSGRDIDFAAVENIPDIGQRMAFYELNALDLSVKSITSCIEGIIEPGQITHLVTVSCTGMSAPGLDLMIVEAMGLRLDVFRTSVNFMGCYAAIHALKLADMICRSDPKAQVMIVATELCTLHFQTDYTPDNAASTLLFADGSAAALVCGRESEALGKFSGRPVQIEKFCSRIVPKGKMDMAWALSSKGFLMTLSGYIPSLVQEDIASLLDEALASAGLERKDVTDWSVHPGGRKIVDVIEKQLGLEKDDLACSRKVLREYGNMSSPTILFVLKEIMKGLQEKKEKANIFGVAFGPGLTMETFIASA